MKYTNWSGITVLPLAVGSLGCGRCAFAQRLGNLASRTEPGVNRS